MKMRRDKRYSRLACAALAALMLMCAFLTGCADGGRKAEDDGRLKIVCTVFPQYDFIRNIAGDRADVELLISPGTEVHGYEPAFGDIANIADCDLLVYVSSVGEPWVDDALRSMGAEAPAVCELVGMVQTFDEELVEGMEADEDEEEGESEIDEHVWTSPKKAMQITDALCGKLCELDSANAEYYRANAALYNEKLAELDRLFEDAVSSGSRRTVVFAERFPFRYLAEDYGLEYYAAFAGCSSETEPSLATITFLVDKIDAEDIPAVFYIEFSKQTVSDTISEATGAKPLLMHSCHNLTQEEAAGGEDYISLMTRNAANLKEALS